MKTLLLLTALLCGACAPIASHRCTYDAVFGAFICDGDPTPPPATTTTTQDSSTTTTTK